MVNLPTVDMAVPEAVAGSEVPEHGLTTVMMMTKVDVEEVVMYYYQILSNHLVTC